MANANDPSDMIKEKENREYVQKSRNQSQNAAMGKNFIWPMQMIHLT